MDKRFRIYGSCIRTCIGILNPKREQKYLQPCEALQASGEPWYVSIQPENYLNLALRFRAGFRAVALCINRVTPM